MVKCFDRNKNKESIKSTSFTQATTLICQPTIPDLRREFEKQSNVKENKFKKQIFLEEIKGTICLCNRLLEKDTSNLKNKDKEKIIKIHWLMNLIIEQINDKIDIMEIYDLNSNIKHGFDKLNNILMKINVMCNNIYRNNERRK